MEKEERKTVPRPESGREEENELVNLRYEVASAKRQITSLQNMLYEMEWQAINTRLSKMKDQLPEIPDAEEPEGRGTVLETVRSRVGSRMETAGENLRRMFEE